MMDRFAGLAIDEIERLEGEVQTQRELIAALAGALGEVERLAAQEVRVGVAADTRVAPPWAPAVLLEISKAARAALARVTEPA